MLGDGGVGDTDLIFGNIGSLDDMDKAVLNRPILQRIKAITDTLCYYSPRDDCLPSGRHYCDHYPYLSLRDAQCF